jgi:hypothetical protein
MGTQNSASSRTSRRRGANSATSSVGISGPQNKPMKSPAVWNFLPSGKRLS